MGGSIYWFQGFGYEQVGQVATILHSTTATWIFHMKEDLEIFRRPWLSPVVI